MEALLTGPVPGLSGGPPGAHPRARRRRSVLCRRDRAHAARPRDPRPRGERVPAHGSRGDAGGTGNAPSAHRGAARRPCAGRAARRPAGLGPRPHVHVARARERLRAGRAAARSSSSRPSSARRSSPSAPTRSRPSAASTASSRTSSRRSPTTRCPAASARRCISAPPSTCARSATRTRSSRCSPPTTSTPTGPSPTTRTRPTSGAHAREMLVRAAERAASLAANEEAQHAYERAAELSDDPLEQADLHEHAGIMARAGARRTEAAAPLRAGDRTLREVGRDPPGRARVRPARGGHVGRAAGSSRGWRSWTARSSSSPSRSLTTISRALAAQLGRFMFFAGQPRAGDRRGSRRRWTSPKRSRSRRCSPQALTTKGMLLDDARPQAGGHSPSCGSRLTTALEHDKPSAARSSLRTTSPTRWSQMDRYDEAVDLVREGLAHARRVGNRYWEWSFLGQVVSALRSSAPGTKHSR